MLFDEPFLHIIEENAIENPIELSKKIYSSTKWVPDQRPDLCPEIYKGESTKFLSEFETKERADHLFNTFKIDAPENYIFASDFQLQKKGGQLAIHTDYNQIAYDVYKEELNLDVIHSITQHIYLPDTDQHPETGAIFHKKQKGSILPVKQIKCLPGTYFAYVNSEISLHSVPKQKHEFNRIIWVSRLIW
jgi:hypothetical protein